MNKIDNENLIKMTNDKIGYFNYIVTEEIKNKKKNKMLKFLGIFILVLFSSITTYALTNISIQSEGKRTIIVNGKEEIVEEYINKDGIIYQRIGGEDVPVAHIRCFKYADSTICQPDYIPFEDIELYVNERGEVIYEKINGVEAGKKPE